MYCPQCAGEFDSQIHRVYHATIQKHTRIPKSARKPNLGEYDRWTLFTDKDSAKLHPKAAR